MTYRAAWGAVLFLLGTAGGPACSDDDSGTDAGGQDQGPALEAGADGGPGQPDGADEGGMPPDMGGGVVVPSNWITLSGGTFSMGSAEDEPCRQDNEAQHSVSLSRDVEVSENEVTQEQFESLMGYNPAFHQDCGAQCPVEWVSWHEAAAYCTALARAKEQEVCYACQGAGPDVICQLEARFEPDQDGLGACAGYRLPTEAEWEAAARAGTTTPFYNGQITSCMTTDNNADAIGWYKVNSSGSPHPVGEKTANDLGLYDMSGNVYEWVHDWYEADLGTDAASDPQGPASGSDRVFRGGAWYFNAEHMRSARRHHFRPDKRFTFLGFRCARSL